MDFDEKDSKELPCWTNRLAPDEPSDNKNPTTLLTMAESSIKKTYINDLVLYNVNPIRRDLREINIINTVRMFKLSGIVLNTNENVLDKLNNIYGAVHNLNLSLVLFIKSDGKNIEFYLGVKTGNEEIENEIGDAFEKLFLGNFPGTQLTAVDMKSFAKELDESLPDNGNNTVTALTSIPALKNENMQNKQFTQGIEKFIDAMQEKKYGILIISDPVSNKQLQITKQGYEELYTELSPLAEVERNTGKSDAISATFSYLKGESNTIGKSVTKTKSFSRGKSKIHSTSESSSKGVNIGAFVPLGPIVVGAGLSSQKSTQEGDAEGKNSSWQKSRQNSNQDSHTTTDQYGVQQGKISTGSEAVSLKFANKSIQVLLKLIDDHLQRIKECENYGMWSSAAYFFSMNKETAVIAASAYKAIVDGENTSLESAGINTWFKEEKLKTINFYLRHLEHPRFNNSDLLLYPNVHLDETPATLVNTKELAIQCGIPYKSVSGVSVREMAEFGRNIYVSSTKPSEKLSVGNIYHMGQAEKNSSVELAIEKLREHTFITGATGSGKSNVIYGLISKIWKDYKIPTLVIEPAKGEYKQIFHNKFNVFGTNPKYTELLCINPFKFDEKIHVLEHIDRLIDIFNVCWPMYAAMPAVLKEAIELAYVSAGWDLNTSENNINRNLYPNFNDLLIALRRVISHSDYSQEVKDNYTGSLITRVKSLTNGLNGRIFSSNEIGDKILFESNAIIDLSRVGSSETKAMIMGILILRLQEHRMAQGGIDLPLKHLTVLEEAHHILKKTSTEQNSEFANLLGKSVEMMGNAIAEMRTYGEGFIIADQAPGLMDMSVIRNTNTKIILRLPDVTDRELVGRAAGLNDDQIVELSRIPTGVAAVYQNKWVEPVLCKVEEFKIKPSEYIAPVKDESRPCGNLVRDEILQLVLSVISKEEAKNNKEYLKKQLLDSDLSSEVKIILIELLENKLPTTLADVSGKIAKCFANQNDVFYESKKAKNMEEWNNMLKKGLNFVMRDMSLTCQNNILECIIREKAVENKLDIKKYYLWKKLMGREVSV